MGFRRECRGAEMQPGEEGVRYRPDLVILAMYPENDLIDNTRELAYALWGDGDPQAFGRPYLVPTGSGWTELPPDYDRALRLASSRTWWRRSAIYGLCRRLRRARRKDFDR